MKKILAVFFLILSGLPAFSQDAAAPETKSFDQKLDAFLEPVAEKLGGVVFYSVPIAKDVDGDGKAETIPVVLVLLAGTALFLTFYFKFVNIRAIGMAFKTVAGKLTDQNAPGEITHFQALSAALSATVGLGNIAGVAIAICSGWPRSRFLDDPFGISWHDFEIL